jgi:hypothetical protein
MQAEGDLEIHGTPPELASRQCDELLCEQYWYRGSLEEPANVIYLRFGSRWHRLTFDLGIIFWRSQQTRPEPYRMSDLEAETRLDDLGARLGLVGQLLLRYEARAVPGGSEIEFQFAGGRSVVFRNVGDRTSILT